jgi:nucleoside-diphosphate-sugar epimerase
MAQRIGVTGATGKAGRAVVAQLREHGYDVPDNYQEFPSFWPDPHARKWNMWGYIDERDVAAACRLALQAPAEAVVGNPAFILPPAPATTALLHR